MTDFSLQITIDDEGLQSIAQAEMSVALLLPQAGADYQVVALLTAPTNRIQISWTDALSLFVSSTDLKAYDVLNIKSATAARGGQAYSFNGTKIMAATAPTRLPDTIQLTNTSTSLVTAGLAKVFTVGSTQQALAITSAYPLMTQGLGSFVIENDILLTLLGEAQVGMPVPSAALNALGAGGDSQHLILSSDEPGRMAQDKQCHLLISAQPSLRLAYTAGNPSQTVHFDDRNARFVQT